MCYETSQLAEKLYREAIRIGASADEIDQLKLNWEQLKAEHANFYHTSGFLHPKLALFSHKNDKLEIKMSNWGLIPSWVKNEASAKSIANKTINARGETLFDKPSFKLAAHMGKCVIPLDGFYEHHHKNNKVYPYYISAANKQRLMIAAISGQWVNKATGEIIDSFSIVTTSGNRVLSEIHNNPKLKGPRMPLILNDSDIQQWMKGSQKDAEDLIIPNNIIKLNTHTVQKLKGSKYLGNHETVQEHFYYEDLNSTPGLFDV